MLLLHPLPTCADAGPDLCTLHLCYPSINQRMYSTCTHGGGRWLQPVLVAFFLQPLPQTLLAPVVVPPVATCPGDLIPSTPWHTYSTVLEQLALCGGSGGLWWYKYIYYI